MYNIDEENSDVIFEVSGNKVAFKIVSSTGGGKSDIYLIKVGDATIPTDKNTFSALRILAEITAKFEEFKDEIGEDLEGKFIRKDQPDFTNFLLSLLGGAVFGKDGFSPGLTGFGAKIGSDGRGEMRALTLWEFLEVPELRFNRVEVFLGIKWRVPGAGIVESVAIDTDANGNELSTGTVTLKLEEGEFGAVSLDDIALGIYHYENPSDNADADADDGKGNFSFAGFGTSYFRVTEVMGEQHNQFRYSLRPGFKLHPRSQMHFSCYGNFTNKDRQTSVYETRTYTRMLWKQNTWEIAAGNIAMQQGDLSNLVIHGMQMEGYSMYLNNVYFTGKITQVKPDGTPIHTANDRGAWVSGKYDFYDRVSHIGCIWLCVNENGTTTEPSKDNADWLLQVDKGESGVSVTNCGPWYSGLLVPQMAITTMGGNAYLAKVATRNPPLWVYTDHAGNGLKYKNGGYVLTGESNTAEYELLVQSGRDGSDGTDFEYVYMHTTSNTKPSRPTSLQQDDYIPSGWHDDPMGASESLPYEWVCKREKNNGIWSAFSDPSIWVKYGFDGLGIKDVDVFYALGDSGNTAPTTGWQTTAPAWENGKYLWSKTKTTYSDGSVVETPPSCISGGKGIKTTYEYYYQSTSPTSLSGGSWSNVYPGWENGKYIWTKTIVTYTDNTTLETTPVCVTGEKGEGYTQLGQWYSGLLVPKMGVVSMGGSTYVAKIATRNPPLWVYTDHAGNRLKYKNGDYVLTGGINTAEYDVWAEKGEDGQDGTDGKPGADGKPGSDGKQGIQGCIIRDAEWKAATEYRNDEALTSGTRYLDIALIRNNSTATGWSVYKCKVTHTSSTSNKPPNTTYWEAFGVNTTSIFTSLIIAKNAVIDFLQGNELLIKRADGSVTAGLSGGGPNNHPIRIWAGGSTPGSAPFRVNENGDLVATRANITGVINAESGSFTGAIKVGDFTINGASDYNQGIYYNVTDNSQNKYGLVRIQPRMFSSVPRNTLLQENNSSLNVLTYLSRARNNQHDRVLYAHGISEFNGRVAISSMNAVDTTADSLKPALFVEGGIGFFGGIHCEPIVINRNYHIGNLTSLTGDSVFNSYYVVDGNDVDVNLQNVRDYAPVGTIIILATSGTNNWSMSCPTGGINWRGKGTVTSINVTGNYEIWVITKPKEYLITAGHLY